MNYIHRHESELDWSSSADGPLRALQTKLLLDDVHTASRAYSFGLAMLERGAATDPYFRHEAELIYILRGHAQIAVDTLQFTLGERGCAYLPAGRFRSISSDRSGDLLYAFVIPCERCGSVKAAEPIDSTRTKSEATDSRPAWIKWADTEEWQPVEPSKGLRVRYKRLMDRATPREIIAGIGLIEPGTHYTLHYHDQPEIYYIESGEGIVYVDGSEVRVRPGSCLDIGGKVVHGADSLGTEPLAIFYVYGCEKAGHTINWTAVEEVYDVPKKHPR
jgi:mannose-6-phosphate isomerase-like protein (cupin superfamily)